MMLHPLLLSAREYRVRIYVQNRRWLHYTNLCAYNFVIFFFFFFLTRRRALAHEMLRSQSKDVIFQLLIPS